MRGALLTLAAAGALFALAAPASAIRITSFRTPSGNIQCAFVGPRAASVRCDIRRTDNAPRTKPRSCHYDYGFSYGVTRRGHARRLCVSDAVGGPGTRVLRYGHAIKRYGIRCTSRRRALRCVNLRGHGFRLSRTAQRLF